MIGKVVLYWGKFVGLCLWDCRTLQNMTIQMMLLLMIFCFLMSPATNCYSSKCSEDSSIQWLMLDVTSVVLVRCTGQLVVLGLGERLSGSKCTVDQG